MLVRRESDVKKKIVELDGEIDYLVKEKNLLKEGQLEESLTIDEAIANVHGKVYSLRWVLGQEPKEKSPLEETLSRDMIHELEGRGFMVSKPGEHSE